MSKITAENADRLFSRRFLPDLPDADHPIIRSSSRRRRPSLAAADRSGAKRPFPRSSFHCRRRFSDPHLSPPLLQMQTDSRSGRPYLAAAASASRP